MTVDPRATALLGRAVSDPASVLEDSARVIAELHDNISKSVAYRAMSIAARNAGTLKQSVAYAKIASDLGGDSPAGLEALGTMARSLATSGEVPRALSVLEEAAGKASGVTAALLEFERGSILSAAGEYEPALEAYESVLPTFRRHQVEDYVSRVLHNQAFIFTHMGRLEQAEMALIRARMVDEKAGRHVQVAEIDHTLGLFAFYRGDIPEALNRLVMADDEHMKYAGDDVPRDISRCEVLMAVGLHHEAFDLARRIAFDAGSQGRSEDQADALLVAAETALRANEPEQAEDLANAARGRFDEQGRHLQSTRSRLTIVEARFEVEGSSSELLTEVRNVARDLEEENLVPMATRALILAGRVAIDLGDTEGGSQDLGRLAEFSLDTAELRVRRAAANAMLRYAQGDGRDADAAARSGLDLLGEFESGLAASDLRSGVERSGVEMERVGLRLAIESGQPRRVFSWMERTRARPLRYRQVLPHAQHQELALLTELRQINAGLRDPARHNSAALLKREATLQEELRVITKARRASSGPEEFGVEILTQALGDRTLVELGFIDDLLMAVVATKGKFSLHEIGSASEIVRDISRLRLDMRRAALLPRDRSALREAVAGLDARVFGDLGLEPGEVVLVPPGQLLAAPWPVFPSFEANTVTVAPSAEVWWRAQTSPASGEGIVLAAGPDLENSDIEVETLAAFYKTATILGPEEGASKFGPRIDGAAIAHIACHVTFVVDNPLFSTLRFGDGEFNVYELREVSRLPDVMVFSACDSGYTDAGAGDELTRFSSALLDMGSKSVVATTGLVPDSEATSDLMLRFHYGLDKGLPVAASLKHAQTAGLDDPDGYIAAASFLCIGAG